MRSGPRDRRALAIDGRPFAELDCRKPAASSVLTLLVSLLSNFEIGFRLEHLLPNPLSLVTTCYDVVFFSIN